MSELKLTFDEAQKHTAAFEEIVASKAKKKSKLSNIPLCDYKWRIQHVESIRGVSLPDILMGKREPKVEMTLDENLEDFCSRSTCYLEAVYKQSRFSHKLGYTPAVIIDQRRESIEEDIKRRAEFAAMPQDEQDKHTADLIKELQKMGGFSVIQVPARRL